MLARFVQVAFSAVVTTAPAMHRLSTVRLYRWLPPLSLRSGTETVRLWSRNGVDVTKRYQVLLPALRMIDGSWSASLGKALQSAIYYGGADQVRGVGFFHHRQLDRRRVVPHGLLADAVSFPLLLDRDDVDFVTAIITSVRTVAWPFSVWQETVFKKCMTCHSKLGETAHNMIAPVLNGLKGRKLGSVATATPAARRSLARIWLIRDSGLSKASRNCENNSPPPWLYSVQQVAVLA
jgi:hypothetical protein